MLVTIILNNKKQLEKEIVSGVTAEQILIELNETLPYKEIGRAHV